jgi:hypothetical protein
VRKKGLQALNGGNLVYIKKIVAFNDNLREIEIVELLKIEYHYPIFETSAITVCAGTGWQ